MNMPVTNTLRVICILACFSSNVKAQTDSSDTSFYQKAVYNTIAVYHQTLGDQSGILSGRQNIPYLFHFREGDPYFETPKFRIGSVVYDGILYENIELLYDELAGLLTMLHYNGRMEFVSDKIERFSISGSQFTRVIKDSANPMPTGFYQQLYTGRTAVLKRNQKTVREELESAEGVTRYIDEKPLFYLKKEGKFYPVKTKKELFALLRDHKKDVQQFIKKNGLNLKTDKQNTLVKVAGYYDQLTR